MKQNRTLQSRYIETYNELHQNMSAIMEEDKNWEASQIALIQNLTCQYALAMDESRMDDWLTFWSDRDPCFENPSGKFVGKEGFQRLLPILTSRIFGKRHFTTNMAITIVDEKVATQVCYMLIMPTSGVAGVVGTAVYRDELVKECGAWKFKSRKIEFDPLTIA